MGVALHIVVYGAPGRHQELLCSSLEADGLAVTVAASPSALHKSLGPGRLALVDVDTAREAGLEAVVLALDGMPVVLVSGHKNDPAGQLLAQRLQVRDTLFKPLSLLDLPDTLRRHLRTLVAPPPARQPQPAPARHVPRRSVAPSPAPASAPNPGVAARNLALLARLWSRHATGTLRLQSPGAAVELQLLGGSPTRPQDFEALNPAVSGRCPLHFQASKRASRVMAPDWTGAGAVLFRAASLHVRRTPPTLDPTLALVLPVTSAIWGALPLAPGTRRVLSSASPQRSVADLVDRAGLALDDVTEQLGALLILGLARLGPVRAAGSALDSDAPTSHSMPSTAHGLRAAASAHPRTAAASGRMRATDSHTPTIPGGLRSHASARVSAPPPAPQRKRSVQRGPRDDDSVSVASTTLRTTRSSVTQAVQKRLRSERDRLLSEGPFVILGIPSSASPDLIRQASSRLQRRYRMLAARPDLDAQSRGYARELEDCVKSAQDRALNGPKPTAPQSVDLLSLGRASVAKEDWSMADKVLTKARDEQLSDPNVLANLGWARLHNPARSESDQREEARDLLLLAEQLAPRDPEVLRYVARFLLLEGQVDRASVRAARLIKANPRDEEAIALVAECQTRKAAQA